MRRLNGVHVLAMLLAFFGSIIAINVAFAVAAVQTFPGEDVRHSYLQGLDYNATLRERRAQAELGWRARAALGGSSSEFVEVDLRDRAGAPISNARIDADLRWPADAHFDRALRFESLGAGHYRARLIEPLRRGQWRLRGRAENGAGALDFEADLLWPSR